MSTNTRTRIASVADLNDRIRDHGSADPGTVTADLLAADLDTDELRVLAAAGLRDHVRSILTRPPLHGPRGRSGTEHVPPGANPSKRMQRIVDHYKQALRVSVYAADDQWLALGDCRIENLRYAAKGRREKGDAVYAEADRYDRLAAALDEHGVDTVAELPRAVGEALIL